ncbi:hypothetical protein ACLMJK_009313 [Lecanora helva]
MTSFSPMVFSPRPSMPGLLLLGQSKRKDATPRDTQFSYLISENGIEVCSPELLKGSKSTRQESVSVKKAMWLSIIDEVTSSAAAETISHQVTEVENTTASSGPLILHPTARKGSHQATEVNITTATPGPLCIRRGKPVASLCLTSSSSAGIISRQVTEVENTPASSGLLVLHKSAGRMPYRAPEMNNTTTTPELLCIRRGKPVACLCLTSSPIERPLDGSASAKTQTPLSDIAKFLCLDNYDVIEEIGNDGEGPCTLVRRRNDHQFRVVKSVRSPNLARGKPIELTILQDIFSEPHQNIIRLHACDLIQNMGSDLWQYQLEYCSGGDLHDLCVQYELDNEWIPELFIWKVFLEIADALEFLHRGFDPKITDRPGIVHRDVKPANIFLRCSQHSTAYPDAVLADFGCATFSFATYEPAGTFRWQPPEIPRKTPKGDVWSLGAVIHQMIHLQAPMLLLPEDLEPTEKNMDRWELNPGARKVISETPEQYSQDLINVMLVALEMNESKRANSSRLLSVLNATMERPTSPNAESDQPLASWALDHMYPEDVSPGKVERYRRDQGCRQYFEMMKLLRGESETY